jgi:AraC-like DNA-binding protein
MTFRIHTPAPPLSQFIDTIWISEGYAPLHSRERVFPDGSMQFIINLREDVTRVYNRDNPSKPHSLCGSIVSGAHSEFVVIDTAQEASVLGVHFRPGGAFPFIGLPANELHNQQVSLEALWGVAASDLRDQLLEVNTPDARFRIVEKALLLQARALPMTLHPALDYALKAFRQIPHMHTIEGMADRVGLSRRQFLRIFDERVGLTPKLYCRVRRFHGALLLMAKRERPEWSELAMDCGYFDQPHFNHDFKRFSGTSPVDHLGQRTEYLNHARLAE